MSGERGEGDAVGMNGVVIEWRALHPRMALFWDIYDVNGDRRCGCHAHALCSRSI